MEITLNDTLCIWLGPVMP